MSARSRLYVGCLATLYNSTCIKELVSVSYSLLYKYELHLFWFVEFGSVA